MITIHKYPIAITDQQLVHFPDGAQLLHVGPDPSGTICVWALVDTLSFPTGVMIYMVGTGHNAGHLHGKAHLGTVLNGPFVWHVFCEPGSKYER